MTSEIDVTLLSRIQHRWLLHANLIIGAIVSLANGGALLLVLAGRGGLVTTAQLPEVAIWLAAGILLLALSVSVYVGIVQLTSALRFQSAVILCLVIALGVWGISLLLPGTEQAHVRWVVGYFSIFAAYAALLILCTVQSATTRQIIRRLCWLSIPAAVVLDILVAFRN